MRPCRIGTSSGTRVFACPSNSAIGSRAGSGSKTACDSSGAADRASLPIAARSALLMCSMAGGRERRGAVSRDADVPVRAVVPAAADRVRVAVVPAARRPAVDRLRDPTVRVPVLRVAAVRGARVLRPRLPTARFAVVRFAAARDVVARLVAARLALTFLAVVFFAAARFGVAFRGAARRRVDFVAVARVPDVLARAVPLRAARAVLFVPARFVAVPLVALLLVAVLAPPRFVDALVLPFAAAMSAPLVVWRLATVATIRRC